ncbi:shieldin complex subunit 1 isoform X2 [Ascaphus truei]
MEGKEATPSQLSESSSVLDLSWSYDITDSVLQSEPPAHGMCEDDFSSILNCASTASAFMEEAELQGNTCEDGDRFWPRYCDRTLRSTLPHNRDTFQPSDPSNFPHTSSIWEEEESTRNNTKLRNTLDAFYELSCQKACTQRETCNAIAHKLSLKMADLRANRHMYALRSFQLAKIILDQDGDKILQSHSKDSAFSPPSGTASTIKAKSIPGFSDDVFSFIIKHN